jgi:hypothetical protein
MKELESILENLVEIQSSLMKVQAGVCSITKDIFTTNGNKLIEFLKLENPSLYVLLTELNTYIAKGKLVRSALQIELDPPLSEILELEGTVPYIEICKKLIY